MKANLIWITVAVLVLARVGWRLTASRRQAAATKSRRRLIKNRGYAAFKGLTVASLKMYFRNRTAIFFSLFFPMVFITVFGLIFKNNSASFKIDMVNQSHTQLAVRFEQALKDVSAFKITDTTTDQAATDLDKGDADLTVTIPSGFGQIQNGVPVPAKVTAHYNEERPGNGQAAAQILQQITSSMNDQLTGAPRIVSVDASGVKTKNLTYIDFLLPGMIGLSIMQIGIFSVAFAFVSYKTTGMLRRLQATPIHPGMFLGAQGLTRLIMGMVQTLLLATIGILFFGFHLDPANWLAFGVLALIGSAVFQEIGFAIAGWAKNEDQAQPVAQLIQFPMMFLSGTFFPRDSFPHLLGVITGFLPLTYLADALRHVANDNASLWAVRGDLLGLLVWAVISGVIAVKVFSWE
ncbi:MAG TPA: ABC transporter permease [Candidatus Saccharimonadia bacterium]|jgi:ABC-2 type transport system permease protein